MNLKDFATAVAKALNEKGIDVILTGGAVVSIYSEGKYVSQDADFISQSDQGEISKALENIGFKKLGKDFAHPKSDFTVEFPGRHLMIGDTLMKPEGHITKNNFTLKLLSPTQCVMDRLAAYYHWNDPQSLEQALLVAKAHPIKVNKVKSWSKSERAEDKFKEFLRQLSKN